MVRLLKTGLAPHLAVSFLAQFTKSCMKWWPWATLSFAKDMSWLPQKKKKETTSLKGAWGCSSTSAPLQSTPGRAGTPRDSSASSFSHLTPSYQLFETHQDSVFVSFVINFPYQINLQLYFPTLLFSSQEEFSFSGKSRSYSNLTLRVKSEFHNELCTF